MSRKLNELLKQVLRRSFGENRLGVAVVLPLFFAGALYGGAPFLGWVCFVVGAACCLEWALFWSRSSRAGYLEGLVGLSVGLAACWIGGASDKPLAGMSFLVLGGVLFMLVGFAWRDKTRPWGQIGIGYLVIGAAGLNVFFLLQESYYQAILVLLVALIVATDVGAWCAGKLIGGPRLLPAVSPGKTWAGFFGGLGAAQGVMVLGLGVGWSWSAVQTWLETAHGGGLGQALAEGAPPWAGQNPAGFFLFALGVSLVAQLADLWESSIKRQLNRKDSSRWLGAHGGFLDRFDSFLGVLVGLPLLEQVFFLFPPAL